MTTFEKAFKRNRSDNFLRVGRSFSDLSNFLENPAPNFLAFYITAEQEYSKGNYQSALELINRTIELSTDHHDWKQYAFKANILEELHQFQSAINSYEIALDISDSDVQCYALYHQIGICYLKLGDNDKSIEFYSYAIDLKKQHSNSEFDPDEEGIYLGVMLGVSFKKMYNNRAGSYLLIKKLNESLIDCEESLRYDKNYSYPYFVLSSIYRKLGDDVKAMDFLNVSAQLGNRKAIRRAQSYVYLNQGIQNGKAKNYVDAINSFAKAIENEPSFEDAYILQGAIKGDTGDFVGAIADFTIAITIDPNNAQAFNNRGFVKIMQKDFDGAIADLSKAIEISPNFAHAFKNRGDAKFGKKDFYGAITDFSQAINIDPNNKMTYNNRGCAKDELSDYQNAIIDYTHVIEFDPQFKAAYNNRGIANNSLMNFELALSDFTKAIEIDPNYAFAYNNRGNAKNGIKDYPGAIADFTKAIAIDPNYAIAYNNRGNAKRGFRDYLGAIADYTKAIEIDPNYSIAYNNLKDIKSEMED